MAEKFGIGPGPHELKIGSSFLADSSSHHGGPKFHTIRYDFKPASAENASNKMGIVDIGESNSLSVSVPNSNGTSDSNYSGHLRDASQKECVLIIDRITGEITLEKLSGHMQLKKTRQERPEKMDVRLSGSTSSTVPRPNTPVTAMKRDSPAATPKAISRSASPHIPSIHSSSNSNSATMVAQPAASSSKIELSESSSSSSSSGSDSDSDLEDVPPVPFQQKAPVNPSVPSFLDTEPPSIAAKSSHTKKPVVQQQQPHPHSMPQFLNDDLQLSESDGGGD